MIYKILHTGDWHLGSEKYGVNRNKEEEQIVNEIIEKAEEERVDLILFSGDITEYPSPPSAFLNDFITKSLGRMAEIAPVIFCKGNHDWRGMAGINNLTNRVVVFNSYGKWENDNFKVFVFPYFEISRLLKDTSHSKINDRANEMLINYFEDIKCEIDYNKVNILLGHFTIDGMYYTGNEPKEIIVNPKQFPEGLNYIAVGHIHNQQKVEAHIPVYYCGSPGITDFGMEKNEYGFIIAEYDSFTREIEVKKIRTSATSFETLIFDIDVLPLEEIKKEILSKLTSNNYYYRININGEFFKKNIQNEIKKLNDRILVVNLISSTKKAEENNSKIDVKNLSTEELYKSYLLKNYGEEKRDLIEKFNFFKQKVVKKNVEN